MSGPSQGSAALSLEEIGALLHRVEQGVLDAAGVGMWREFGYLDRVPFGMFSRCVSLFRGVRLLLKAGLPDEGMVLGRGLYEDSLRLQELAQCSKAERDRRSLWWANESINRERGLAKAVVHSGQLATFQEALSALEQRRAMLLDWARKHGIGSGKSFLPVEEAAKRFGRLGSLWAYEAAHHMVHGDEIYHLSHQQTVGRGSTAFFVERRDPVHVAGVATFSAESIIVSCQAARAIFGWSSQDETAALFASVEELDRRAGEVATGRPQEPDLGEPHSLA